MFSCFCSKMTRVRHSFLFGFFTVFLSCFFCIFRTIGGRMSRRGLRRRVVTGRREGWRASSSKSRTFWRTSGSSVDWRRRRRMRSKCTRSAGPRRTSRRFWRCWSGTSALRNCRCPCGHGWPCGCAMTRLTTPECCKWLQNAFVQFSVVALIGLVDGLIDWFIDYRVDWLLDLSTDSLVDCKFHVDWLIDSLLFSAFKNTTFINQLVNK